MSSEARLFQIWYDAETRAAVDPDFEPLDNAASERPDWFEMWPIRRYLTGAALDEGAYYGFFSPRFHSKTHLRGAQVREFLRGAGGADLVTFSPHPCHSACFINVFQQAEAFYPGIYATSAEFLRDVDPAFNVDLFITHSRNTVFSNYFAARPPVWRRWLSLYDRVLAHADAPGSPLFEGLRKVHEYRKEGGPAMSVQRKVFVMERMISYLIESARLTVVNYPPFAFPRSERFADRLEELKELDRLKLAFVDTGRAQYLYDYAALRERVLRSVYRSMEPTAVG